MKMRKLLLISVFAGLTAMAGVTASFARDYHNYDDRDYYTKDGHLDHNYYGDHDNWLKRDYKYNNHYDNNDWYYDNHRKQYLKKKRYFYRHDYGNHYGYRHNHDNDFWDTLFLGFVFK